MKYIFITGSSKGLGKALAELFLEQSNTQVIGIARTCTIQHENYTHHPLDLSNPEMVNSFTFPQLTDAKEILLINNAGMLNPIKKIGTFSAEEVSRNIQVNLTSPIVLSNHFIKQFQQLECKRMIINISSGAGKKPIDGWAAYCSTKSGLNMFSEVMQAEQNLISYVYKRIRVIALSPGVIDTEMQAEIRESNSSDFSAVEQFKSYKQNGELQSAQQTAGKIISNLHLLFDKENVICSLRDY